MMLLLIFSDSHGGSRRLHETILSHPAADAVIHLGDGAREAVDMAAAFPSLPFFCVRGNCDMGSELPLVRLEVMAGRRLLMSHGHLHRVKSGPDAYLCAARENGAEIALFGHTHRPFEAYRQGVYLFNPGSLREGSYGMLEISPVGILLQHLTR